MKNAGCVHTVMEKFENTGLFLRLGLQFPLILLEEFVNAGLGFSVNEKYFENRAFRKRRDRDYQVIPLSEFSLDINPE